MRSKQFVACVGAAVLGATPPGRGYLVALVAFGCAGCTCLVGFVYIPELVPKRSETVEMLFWKRKEGMQKENETVPAGNTTARNKAKGAFKDHKR